MPLILFITGASGYIGSVLTSLATSQHHTVHALSRTPTSDAHLSTLGAIPIRGDLSTHDILAREAARADVTINIADSIAGRIGKISHEERFRINEEAVEALARGIEGTGKKLVLTSGSLFTGADPQGNETDEDALPWENSPFGKGMEGSYQGLKERGVNVNVVRLAPWVYGRAGSGVKLFMQGAAQTGVVEYVDDGRKRTTTVHVEDAARLYLLVAEKANAGEIYNATSETDVTFRKLAEAMGEVMGVPVVSQPYGEVEAKVGEFLANFLCSENRASNAKAKRELGWTIEAEKGILKEIVSGSYVQLAEELRKTAV
ncbi:putative NAD dependent epimerase/dehydratase [Phaeosphaeriaceae sp. SRC1lsM3a]|nr:putative NAD dependent epimerase/dehydratase [Stagonospora sp. SRC1lsM3a]